jgi:exosortase F-associated protein
MDSGAVLIRVLLGAFGLVGLISVYIFQRIDLVSFFSDTSYEAGIYFIANRFVRIFFNDLFMLIILYALFADRKVLLFAFWIQIIDLFILLPIYLAIKLTLEGDSEISSPFLSQFHRLIVNPTLMILLIPAVYYQKIMLRKN